MRERERKRAMLCFSAIVKAKTSGLKKPQRSFTVSVCQPSNFTYLIYVFFFFVNFQIKLTELNKQNTRGKEYTLRNKNRTQTRSFGHIKKFRSHHENNLSLLVCSNYGFQMQDWNDWVYGEFFSLQSAPFGCEVIEDWKQIFLLLFWFVEPRKWSSTDKSVSLYPLSESCQQRRFLHMKHSNWTHNLISLIYIPNIAK